VSPAPVNGNYIAGIGKDVPLLLDTPLSSSNNLESKVIRHLGNSFEVTDARAVSRFADQE
jgi:hypothetical protein